MTAVASDRSGTARRLAVRGVACRRGDRILFRDLDLDVAPGELVWLRAANGFGKTTLLRVLAGLGRPEAGTVEWIGTATGEDAAPVLYLAHANALKDDLTIDESVRDMARLHGLDASEATLLDAIGLFGLDSRRHAPIRTLSHGQRRRVALTRLCLSPPTATWILDEPFDALDADGSALVGRLLRDHARRGGRVLLTSHVAPPVASADDATDVPMRTVQLDAAERSSTPSPPPLSPLSPGPSYRQP